jgi:pyroglutamyl-peptidase
LGDGVAADQISNMTRTTSSAMRSERRGGGRPRLLVSGFGPFPGIPFNASAELASSLAQMPEIGGSQAVCHAGLLPTAWQGGPEQAARLIRELEPDAIVHFGVSSAATGFQIETRAVNATRADADCEGCLPSGFYVRRGGPPVLAATLPTGLIFRRLKQAGVPVAMSQDAGRYLCNAVLYQSLLLARSLPNPPLTGFIHIPALPPESGDPAVRRQWAELRRGFPVILRAVSEAVRSARQRSGAARPNRLRPALA